MIGRRQADGGERRYHDVGLEHRAPLAREGQQTVAQLARSAEKRNEPPSGGS